MITLRQNTQQRQVPIQIGDTILLLDNSSDLNPSPALRVLERFNGYLINRGRAQAERIIVGVLNRAQRICPARHTIHANKVVREESSRGNFVYSFVDSFGRPVGSTVMYDRGQFASRGADWDFCRSRVGNFATGIGASDGGHLVPSRLDGNTFRTNLVPQNRRMNQTMWNHDVEAKSAECVAANNGLGHRVIYSVYAYYRDSNGVTPHTMLASTLWHNADRRRNFVSFGMPNVDPRQRSESFAKATLYKTLIDNFCLAQLLP